MGDETKTINCPRCGSTDGRFSPAWTFDRQGNPIQIADRWFCFFCEDFNEIEPKEATP